jgi:hypothetical protein
VGSWCGMDQLSKYYNLRLYLKETPPHSWTDNAGGKRENHDVKMIRDDFTIIGKLCRILFDTVLQTYIIYNTYLARIYALRRCKDEMAICVSSIREGTLYKLSSYLRRSELIRYIPYLAVQLLPLAFKVANILKCFITPKFFG